MTVPLPALALLPIGAAAGFGVAAVWSRFGRIAARALGRLRARGRPSRFTAVHVDEIEWRQNQMHRERTTFFMKPLPRDSEAGDVLMLVRYPAGQINPAHVHPVGHGMYVLQGRLATNRGTFGPNTFVWFPAHEAMWHGADRDEDVVVLFCTGPDMGTRYLEGGQAQDVA